VIKHAEKMKNCNAAKMFRAVEADKYELYLKISQWTQDGHFQQFAQGLVESVHLNRKTLVPGMCDTVNFKAGELAKSQNNTCVYM